MDFKIGQKYKISEIRAIVGHPGKGGKWVKGYLEHNGIMFIFANIKSPGFGGQQYNNRWLTSQLLEWSGNTKSKVKDRYIQLILDPEQTTHLFTREEKYLSGGELTYQGTVRALDIYEEEPVYILLKVKK